MNTKTMTTKLKTAKANSAAVRDLFVATLDDEGRALRGVRDSACDAYLAAYAIYHKTRAAADLAILNSLKPAYRESASAYSQYLLSTRATRARRAVAACGGINKLASRTIDAINTIAL